MTKARSKSRKESRICADCGSEFQTSVLDRFCKPCRKAFMAKMREDGYLTEVPWRSPYNSTNNFDPHIDEENPSFENAVRALEEN